MQPNAKGFYESIGFAQQTTRDEIAAGFLSKAYKYPMFIPLKIHSRNVAWQFRNGKEKPRGTGDLGLAGRWEEHSTNAGWPLDEFPDYEYGCSEHFARDTGVVRTAYDDTTGFEIRKNDWKGASSCFGGLACLLLSRAPTLTPSERRRTQVSTDKYTITALCTGYSVLSAWRRAALSTYGSYSGQ